MKTYFAKATPTTHGFMIAINNVPEAVTEGATLAEAISLAEDVLLEAKKDYKQRKEPFPLPIKLCDDDLEIQLKHGLTKQKSNAQKNEQAKDSWIQIRVEKERKSKYVHLARKKGLKLSDFILQTLDEATQQKT